MKKYPQLALSLSALIAYGAVVCAGYFHARAKAANEACGVDCLMQKGRAMSEKTAALEHTLTQSTVEVGESIKSGQTATLHTQAGADGGCLTFTAPSGDRGGYVSWNVDCSHGTLWKIN